MVLLRQWQRPSEGFFKFFHGPGGPALATVYNADLSQGADRLLFAINPTMVEFTIPLDGERIAAATGTWQMLADQDRFYLADAHGGRRPVEEPLWVSPLSCTLWVSRG